ncbi:cytochrome D1 domain-containing protein [Derxia gummosa]|uniref:Cytochrome D1 domain-containing protein n=1 Tax=Derxia gummosa DSM 723 TaxID=1121388 RepID=A0A8B6X650_9BURK|nr:cytochrome D1 domain-containing protein [Derxia gummosa]
MIRRLLAGAAFAALGLSGTSALAQTAVVLNSRDAQVSLLDMKEGRETGRLDVGKEPHHLYPTPDGKSLIVANALGNDLTFLDPKTGAFQRKVAGIDDPYQIGFAYDNKRFVVNSLRLDRVDVYDYDGASFKLVKRFPLKSMPSHMAFTHDSGVVYITLQGSNQVAALDLRKMEVMWQVPVGEAPAGIFLTPDQKYLLVGIMGADYVEVIDVATRQTVKRIKTGMGCHNFRALGDKRHVFVGNRVANTINMIDMQTLENVATIPVPGGPDDMEITADGKQLWTTSRFIKQVTVVDLATRQVVRKIPVGRSPHGIFFVDRAPLL